MKIFRDCSSFLFLYAIFFLGWNFHPQFYFLFILFFILKKLKGPLHIPAKRYDPDPSVIRHAHPWGTYDPSTFETPYSHPQYYLDRDRKPPVGYYGYAAEAQFPQVI